MSKIMVIPDLQIRAEVELQHLRCIGEYIVATKPDYIVLIGDVGDFPSISSHNTPYEQEGHRLIDDVNSVRAGLDILFNPLKEFNSHMKELKKKQYKPKMYVTLGNHEDRLIRYLNNHPELVGFIPDDVLGFAENNIKVIGFKEILTIDNVNFSHYFQTTANGNPPSSARALLNKRASSCIMGHRQGLDWAHTYTPDGRKISAIIAGSCYMHDEPYMCQMNKTHWRGLIMLDNVDNGSFDECFVPLKWLCNTYNFNPEETIFYPSTKNKAFYEEGEDTNDE